MNKEKLDILQKSYYSPKGLQSVRNLYLDVKKIDKTFTVKQVQYWLKSQEITQLYRKPKKEFHTIVASNDYYFKIDLMFLTQFNRFNKGYHILLNIRKLSLVELLGPK